MFPGNVSDTRMSVSLGKSYGEFAHIDMSEFSRHGDPFAPVHASAVVLPNGGREIPIREAEILQ